MKMLLMPYLGLCYIDGYIHIFTDGTIALGTIFQLSTPFLAYVRLLPNNGAQLKINLNFN
jgi:hypothetical protein